MEVSVAVVLLSYFAPALGSAFGREMPASPVDEIQEYDKPFHYDYESLRIGGMIFAVVLFLMGIFLIIMTKSKQTVESKDVLFTGRKCRCSGSKSRPVGVDPESARVGK